MTPRPTLSVGEAVVGAVVVAFALLAWVSLALADVGLHHVLLVVALTAAACGALVRFAVRSSDRPRLRVDRGELAMIGVVGVVAGVMFFPGFPYGVGDKDPGVYVEHAAAIARNHDVALTDPAAPLPVVQPIGPGARFPGVWIHDAARHRIVPQFFHLFPATLATAKAAFGYGGLTAVNPFAGVLAVLVAALALRRVAGPVAGWLVGLLLATCMLQVWQAKYPTSEVLAQLLHLGSLWGIVLALRLRWRLPAAVAGLLLGISYLNRADGVLMILLAVGVGSALLALRRFDDRCRWFAAGLAVTLPHAVWQAYALMPNYTNANLPAGRRLAALAVAMPIVGFGSRRLLPRLLERLGRLVENRRAQFVAGGALVVTAGLLMVLGFLRARIFGADYFDYNGRIIRSYDEQSLRRLSWFITLPGFVLLWFGIAVVALRRWSAATWALLTPGLLMLAIYGYRAYNSTRLMWWPRRFVPVVLPGMLMLIAIALAWLVTRRGRAPLRVAAIAATAYLMVVFVGQSWPLRGHREFAGSWRTLDELAALAPDSSGVFLFEYPRACCAAPATLFGGPLWLTKGQTTLLALKSEPEPSPAYLRSVLAAFPDRRVFLVTADDVPPPGDASLRLSRALRVDRLLPMWAESDTERPDHAITVPVRMTVWRLSLA